MRLPKFQEGDDVHDFIADLEEYLSINRVPVTHAHTYFPYVLTGKVLMWYRVLVKNKEPKKGETKYEATIVQLIESFGWQKRKQIENLVREREAVPWKIVENVSDSSKERKRRKDVPADPEATEKSESSRKDAKRKLAIDEELEWKRLRIEASDVVEIETSDEIAEVESSSEVTLEASGKIIEVDSSSEVKLEACGSTEIEASDVVEMETSGKIAAVESSSEVQLEACGSTEIEASDVVARESSGDIEMNSSSLVKKEADGRVQTAVARKINGGNDYEVARQMNDSKEEESAGKWKAGSEIDVPSYCTQSPLIEVSAKDQMEQTQIALRASDQKEKETRMPLTELCSPAVTTESQEPSPPPWNGNDNPLEQERQGRDIGVLKDRPPRHRLKDKTTLSTPSLD